jgi:hypothetical protein
MTEFEKYRNKETGEEVEAKILADCPSYIQVKRASKNFPNYILITGAKFYEEVK